MIPVINPHLIGYAFDCHEKTNHRYGPYPYSVHLSMVASYGYKYIDLISDKFQEVAIGCCYCHDLIEDARVTYNDLRIQVGQGIADIVYLLTNEKGKTREERASHFYYQGIRENPIAIFVKLCDRLANVKYCSSAKMDYRMFKTYLAESDKFIGQLVPVTGPDYRMFYTMVEELTNLFIAKPNEF